MEEKELQFRPREAHGSAACRRYRRQNLIPTVVYANGIEPVSGLLDYNGFVHQAERSMPSQVFTLKSELPAVDGRRAIVKGIQKDYLKGRVLHVDLQALVEGQLIRIRVPLHFNGEAYGVKTEGGILTTASHELVVECSGRSIPSSFEVDISELRLGQSIHARDIPLPDGVDLAVSPDETLVSVVEVRATKVEGEEEVAAEGAVVEGAAVVEKKEKKE